MCIKGSFEKRGNEGELAENSITFIPVGDFWELYMFFIPLSYTENTQSYTEIISQSLCFFAVL